MTRPVLAMNALQPCPSRACHQWHLAHGLEHECGVDRPDHLRVPGVVLAPSLGRCGRCGGPAPVAGRFVLEHPTWASRQTDDGRRLQVQTQEPCPGAGTVRKTITLHSVGA